MSDSNFEHFLADLEERDVQYGELARLAFDCSSRLDRCLAWCDREIEWLSRGPTAYGEGRLKSVQEIKAILVERQTTETPCVHVVVNGKCQKCGATVLL